MINKDLIEKYLKFKSHCNIYPDIELKINLSDYLEIENTRYKEIFKQNQEFINKYINTPEDVLCLINYIDFLFKQNQTHLGVIFFSIYFQYRTRLNHDKKTTRKNKTN
jgi:hypothetical protein